MRIIALGVLTFVAGQALAEEPKRSALTPEEQKLVLEARRLSTQAAQEYQNGKYAEAIATYHRVWELGKKLYPAERFPDGHIDLAVMLNNLGYMLVVSGEADRGATHLRNALAMYRKIYPESKHPDGHTGIAACLGNLALALKSAGLPEQARPLYEQSLAMRRRLYPLSKYPDGHSDVAMGLNNLAMNLQDLGTPELAVPHLEEALAIRRRLFPESKFPSGHLDIAVTFNNLGGVLKDMGELERALPFYEQGLAMYRKLYPPERFPDGHPDLARSINNLGFVLVAMGASERALIQFEQALAMFRKLYPESKYPAGHPELSTSINNVAFALSSIGAAARAIPYLEEALAMTRKLFPRERFPKGHQNLAQSLHNLARTHERAGDTERSRPYYDESLAMYRELYPPLGFPDGHPELARSLECVAGFRWTTESPQKARPLYEEALAMRRRLFPTDRYPDGHADLARSLLDLGGVLSACGAPDEARPHLEAARAMSLRIARRLMLGSSETDALSYLETQPPYRDGLLSLPPHGADYAAVWDGKAVATRIHQDRLAAARAAGTEHAKQLDDLKQLRRRVERLLQDRRRPDEERDRMLAKAMDDRDSLERTLAKAVPLLGRASELDGLPPEALLRLLSEGAVFIDFVRYTRYVFDPTKPNRSGDVRIAQYAGFMLARGRAIERVELGPAEPIDRAITEWRRDIDSKTESQAANRLRELIWVKLANRLPNGASDLYISPDGDLARLPWAALPIGNGRVLLEDFVVAEVPHGPFLLEQFKYPPVSTESEAALVLANVDHGNSAWPALPGTAAELEALRNRAGDREVIELAARNATAARVREALSKVRYAHFATHGYFDADTLGVEKKRNAELIATRQFGDNTRRVAARNPLGFTGVVLANGELVTGLSLLNMPMENLRLATLSACETGLGELTEGEGVFGLTRAFHLAGCSNVVASLWKVNDAATAALMAKFYHELWVNKKPPIAALREAQLFIYYNPDKIPDVLGERGAPKRSEALAMKNPAKPQAAMKRADTKLWAAFVLSGTGK